MNRCSDRHLMRWLPWACWLSLLAGVPAAAMAQMAAAVESAAPYSTSAAPLVPMALARTLPPTSLRGDITFVDGQQALLNGKADTLAPGLRIRAANNMLIMPGMVIGQKFTVNYLRDSYGLINEVWILRDDERAGVWPKTQEEAAKWLYDLYTHTWKKS